MARKIELNPLVKKILIALAIMILILLVICITIETARSRKEAATSQQFQQKILADYTAKVAQKTDAYALTKSGLRQLNINLPNLSLISLKRATEIEKNYRDAWLALGLAQAKTGDVKTALASFQAAEKLDPIYAKTYEFLKLAYEKLEDMVSAGKAGEKYQFLVKTK